MYKTVKIGFFRSIRGKILIASILACLALFLAWQTSKDAFKSVLISFEKISAPNDKLRLINDISHRVARLDQVQKALLLKNPSKYYGFFIETQKLSLKIDTLKLLYKDRPNQVLRLNTLKKLLHDRDKLYIGYLNVRYGLINTKSFNTQIQRLNEMVNKSASQKDSLVTTTEKKTSTTTIFPARRTIAKDQHISFFSKLFGKKKKNENYKAKTENAYKVVDSEYKIKHDTLAIAMRDSLLKGVGKTILHLEKTQQRNSELFVKREALLNKASANVIGQILVILRKVENEVITQTSENNKAASQVVQSGIKRISIIMLLFLVVTVILVYLILRDITRINKYRKEIERAKEEAEYHSLAKQRFLANMSHEIRTPLQSIIGYSEIIKQQRNPKKNDIEAIYKSSNHLLQIVNEVLDYNRIISGKFVFVNETFHMQGLLDEIISVLRLQAEKKELILSTDYDPSISAFLNGDPFRLKQIFYNIIGNAIKFTQQGKVELKVRGRQVGEKVHYQFDISDTGVGLSANDINRIFNEFEQAGDERQARKGTGLGLAISKQLIESQGGTLVVTSELGRGSCFTFNLVLSETPEQSSYKSDEIKAPDELTPYKVWIVDDDRYILDLCARIFEENKIECRCFDSPFEVMETTWDNTVKYLLIDIRMPGMSGIELCLLLRQKIPADTLIYALTAQVMPEEHNKVLKGGFNGVLTKPFRESELLNLIKKQEGLIAPHQGHPLLNMKSIRQMTFGDPALISKLLLRFSEDSANDIEEIHSRINENNAEAVLLLLHRIAGRTAQAGGRELAEKFRLAEMELEKEKALTAERIKHILWLTSQLHDLVTATLDHNKKQSS